MLRLGADDAPVMHPVACRRCGTEVLVRKNSLTQTTVQWRSDSSACPELAARRAAGEDTARVAHCELLRTSIDEAVADGRVRIVE